MKRNLVRRFAVPVIVLALLLVAGCFRTPTTDTGDPPASQVPSRPHPGLPAVGDPGLPPGPFVEDQAELQRLAGFLRSEKVDRLLSDCGAASGSASAIRSHLENEMHLRAVEEIQWACVMTQAMKQKAEEMSKAARRHDKEEQVYWELRSALNASLERANVALASVDGPGSIVEAEVLAWSQWGLAVWNRPDTRHGWWTAYQDGTAPSRFQLESVYDGLLSDAAMADSVTAFVEAYPWLGKSCIAPTEAELDALGRSIRARLDEVETLTETQLQGREDQPGWLYLYNHSRGKYDVITEKGWWESMLALDSAADLHLTYWHGLNQSDDWPSLEEAKGMLAYKRNESRNLWSEITFSTTLVYYQDRQGPEAEKAWHRDIQEGAAAFYADMAYRWPFEDLECPAAPDAR